MTKIAIEKELGISLDAIASSGVRGLTSMELVGLYTTAVDIKPKVIVEIGACQGVASTILGYAVSMSQGHLYSYDILVQPKWHQNIRANKLSSYATLIEAESPNIDIDELPFNLIDYLLIDGDHSYDGAMADYLFWSPLVRTNGRIAFHDYYSHKGVRRVVSEIMKRDALCKAVEVPGKMYNSSQSSPLGSGMIVLTKNNIK